MKKKLSSENHSEATVRVDCRQRPHAPIDKKTITLDKLLADVTQTNIPEDWAIRPAGQETL
jgi:hypothetical protein